MTRETIRERIDRVRALEFVTVEDAALLCSVSQKTIRRRLAGLSNGDLLRVGRAVRVRRTALLRLFRPGG